jgi:hypothetical protein
MDMDMDISWSALEERHPPFAASLARRFAAHPHHVLATLRADGSPRLSGLEVAFRQGSLWLAMMHSSRKAVDLRRDPRFALHANPGGGTSLDGGDARLTGLAHEVTDPDTVAQYTGRADLPARFHLFRAHLTGALLTTVERDELVLRVWDAPRGLRTIRRRDP